tara:strand:+ start:70 stop:1875 length:1806 start_codon:yes stop_codon:yes gene_type:complete
MNEDELTQEDVDEYNKRRQKEYDEATKGNEEIRRKQEEEKQKGFRDAGSAFRTTAAIGTEVGLNTLLDLFSFIPPAQVVGGSAINYLAQRIRGGEFSRGEFIASGLASLIPGGAQAKSVLRDTAGKQLAKGIGKGAVSGALETGAADLIDTGKIDAENVLAGAGAGGLFGGAFTTTANIPQIQNLAQRIRTGTGNIIESLTPGPVRIAQGDLIGNVTAGQFSNNAPKNPREWRYRPPDATQSYKINQTLLNNAVLDNGTFSTKLYEDGKVDSKWGRMIGINYQTNPNTRVGWDKTKRELRHTWEGLYGQAMKRKGYETKDIQIEHIFTIQQSMPIYEGVRFGSDLYNQIQAKILRRGYDPGNTDRNLMAILPHLHQQKTNYFNALHGRDGRKFFTQDMIDQFAAGNNELRFEMLDKYLNEIDQGKKILNDAIEVFDSLNVERGYMPEEIAERLGQIELNKYSAPELKQIFLDMEAEGFKLNPKQSAKAEAAEIKTEKQVAKEKAKQQKRLDKDDSSVQNRVEVINKFINQDPSQFQKTSFAFGMQDEDLRELAEAKYNELRRNRLIREDIQDDFFEAPKKREEAIKLIMKSILNQQRRSSK